MVLLIWRWFGWKVHDNSHRWYHRCRLPLGHISIFRQICHSDERWHSANFTCVLRLWCHLWDYIMDYNIPLTFIFSVALHAQLLILSNSQFWDFRAHKFDRNRIERGGECVCENHENHHFLSHHSFKPARVNMSTFYYCNTLWPTSYIYYICWMLFVVSTNSFTRGLFTLFHSLHTHTHTLYCFVTNFLICLHCLADGLSDISSFLNHGLSG